jgi:diguanylate cyclase (GGDEF)-like protein
MEKYFQMPRPQNRKFGKRVMIWLAAVGIILTGITVLLFSSITFLLKSEGWVAHSYQVLDALDLTEAHYSDAQSAERGYVATCKPTLLSPFRRDLPQIFGELASLHHLTMDNPAQQGRAVSLSKAVSDELARMSNVVRTTTNGQQLAAETMLENPADAAENRDINKLIDEMQAEERLLLDARLKNVTLFAWTTLISSAIGIALIAFILVFLLRLIKRETARRERTESSLQESNVKLEGSLEELRRYNASARAVSLLGELLQTCRSTEEAVSIATRHLGEVFPGMAVAISLFNNSRDSVDVIQSQGDGALFSPHFRANDCWGLRRGRIHSAGSGGFEPSCTHLDGPGRHFLCIPMIAQGDTLGVLSIATGTKLADFEAQTTQTISEQLSLALANLKLQETLRNQSFRDPLTGLYNRRYMDEAMQQEVTRAGRHSTPLSIAMLDIDHFKRFNDTYGHEGGDALLAAFGKLLASHARSDDIVCRYGGEEFAIILPSADIDTAAARLQEIRAAVKKLQVLSNGQHLGPVTMSAGVAVFPRDGATGGMVLAASDAALYEAKRSGRDRVVCAPAGEAATGTA